MSVGFKLNPFLMKDSPATKCFKMAVLCTFSIKFFALFKDKRKRFLSSRYRDHNCRNDKNAYALDFEMRERESEREIKRQKNREREKEGERDRYI